MFSPFFSLKLGTEDLCKHLISVVREWDCSLTIKTLEFYRLVKRSNIFVHPLCLFFFIFDHQGCLWSIDSHYENLYALTSLSSECDWIPVAYISKMN